jgi:hypothetical protein
MRAPAEESKGSSAKEGNKKLSGQCGLLQRRSKVLLQRRAKKTFGQMRAPAEESKGSPAKEAPAKEGKI